MYYLFRHLFYLGIFSCVSLLIIGFAHEKLGSNTTSVAFLGFSAFVVHIAAFWYVLGPSAPIAKAIYCLALMCGCVAAVAAGQWFQITLEQGTLDQWTENLKFTTRVVPVWWLLLVIETVVVKEVLRWQLVVNDETLSEPLSIRVLFESTAVLGIALGISTPTIIKLYSTDYLWLAIASSVVHLLFCLPLVYVLLSVKRRSKSRLFLVFSCLVGGVLTYLASFRFLSGDLHSVANVAIAAVAFIAPFIMTILFAREKRIYIVSAWTTVWSELKRGAPAVSERTLL